MTVQEEIHGLGIKARAAAQALRACTTQQKNAALEAIAAARPELTVVRDITPFGA